MYYFMKYIIFYLFLLFTNLFFILCEDDESTVENVNILNPSNNKQKRMIMSLFIAFLAPVIIFGVVYKINKNKVKNMNNAVENNKNINNHKSDNIPKSKTFGSSKEVVDICRTKWQKNMMAKVAENSCCLLYDYISKLHNEYIESKKDERNNNNVDDESSDDSGIKDWGSILDAGTGNHSIDWLLKCPRQSLAAITGDKKYNDVILKNFGDRLQETDELVLGNWLDKDLLKGRQFDFVIADYLLGAIEAYSPYFQDLLFDRLYPHVKERLYVVGLEPFPDHTSSKQGQFIIQIAKLRDSCIMLAGDRCNREYPLEYVTRQLKRSNFKIDAVACFESNYSKEYLLKQIQVAESKVKKFAHVGLQIEMVEYISAVKHQINQYKWPFGFGNDYVVAASKV
eukprot:TRINITY_DN16010_c0_g1_i1.p1 TRINITY_DN16010_c0_g1~~TRINITY_DN16010_c0_g1_i1.p1  ORF type:complete len:397 (+),score=105.03 TRINITY_DN16010_c0_g1_i1:71-1261(+)